MDSFFEIYHRLIFRQRHRLEYDSYKGMVSEGRVFFYYLLTPAMQWICLSIVNINDVDVRLFMPSQSHVSTAEALWKIKIDEGDEWLAQVKTVKRNLRVFIEAKWAGKCGVTWPCDWIGVEWRERYRTGEDGGGMERDGWSGNKASKCTLNMEADYRTFY